MGPQWQLVEAGIHQGESVGRGPTRTQIIAKVQPSVWRRGTLQCLVGLYPNIFSILLQKANIK